MFFYSPNLLEEKAYQGFIGKKGGFFHFVSETAFFLTK
jgi:hypothetical protein